MRTTMGEVRTTIQLTERETTSWEDAGPDGDEFRKSLRARARDLGGFVEISSHDGIVFDAVESEGVSDDDLKRARDEACRTGDARLEETGTRALGGDVEARIKAVPIVSGDGPRSKKRHNGIERTGGSFVLQRRTWNENQGG